MTVVNVILCLEITMVLSTTDKAVIRTLFLEKGWRGARIVKELPGQFRNRNAVNRVIKRIEETGGEQWKRKEGTGRQPKVTDQIVEEVKELAASQEDNPGSHLSQRKIANRLDLSKTTVQRVISKRLKMKAFKRIKTSRKTTSVKQKRKTRARVLLDSITAAEFKTCVFSDKKNFTLEVPPNTKNNAVYGEKQNEISASKVYHQKNHFSKNAMVSAGISWNGKIRIHFIETGSVKVNAERYVTLLNDKLTRHRDSLS